MELSITSTESTQVIDVTSSVDDAVPSSIESGLCLVYVPHTTAGVVVNEAEPGLLEDLAEAVDVLVPDVGGFRHDEIDDNAPAHIKATLLGESVTVPIDGGGLAMGTWQSILFVEADGPRDRRLRIVVLSE